MPRSILIVEDSEDDAFLLKRTLTKCGIGNALAYLDSDEPCPGIIFVDLKMPGITGLQLLAKIKARPDCADVLLFMVSGHDDLQTVRQAYALGASSFISKPIRAADLENLIHGFPRHWERSQKE